MKRGQAAQIDAPARVREATDGERYRRWVLYFLILASGAAGLIYEVVWARQLTLFLGNTAIANAAVLTAFMAGLALGSWVLGRVADATASPLRLYAILEIAIGLYGATTPWLFSLLQQLYAQVAGVVGVTGPYSHLPRFFIAIAALLLPTFLMGGTLPLLVRHFTGRLDQAQSVTSRIYGINTMGATLGAFSAGFLLLPLLGIHQSLLTAAGINVLVGLAVYPLFVRAGSKTKEAPAAVPAPEVAAADTINNPSLLLVGFAFSGFAALLYQVVWIHSLVLVIGVSIYAFSTVLTVFLAGIGLGSLVVGRFLTNAGARRSLQLAFYLQMGIALSAVASLSLIAELPILFVKGWAKLHESFALFQGYTFLLSGIVMLVPTLLLGALFPLITGVWSSHKGAVGRGVGDAYGANALGTIAGSAIGGLYILQWLGIAGSLYLASGVSVLVAVLFWYMANPQQSVSRRWMQAATSAALLAVVIFTLPGWNSKILQTEVFRRSARYLNGDVRAEIARYLAGQEFLYYKEGINGTVSVTSWVGDGVRERSLVTNGKVDASTASDMSTQLLLGQLPLFLHPEPGSVMVIGLGSGITAGSVLQNPRVNDMDVLEISPEVVEASEFFKNENHDVLSDPRTNLIVSDARNYMLASDKKYDVIISEPSHSWATGVSNLFTREFLQLANDRLSANGILVQWYHIYEVDRGSLKSLLRSVSDVFPHFTVWYVSGGDIIIVSSNQTLELDYQKQRAIFESPPMKKELERIGIGSVTVLMNHLFMSSNELQALLAGQQSNTDIRPFVEFNAPKYMYQFTNADNIRMLFGELGEDEYRLPVSNLVREFPEWIVVDFMGVQINHGGGPYSMPNWNIIRKSVFEEESEKHQLLGGMNGNITFEKPWGEVLVRTTMAERGTRDENLAISMMAYEVSDEEQVLSGELRAPGDVIYWRAGASDQAGKIHVVLARECKRESKFDNWVSISTHYPGNVENREDTGAAIKSINQLVRCTGN